MGKSLAVIMSVYIKDKIEFVKPSIESILSQTYNDFDLYLQYDGPIASDVSCFLNSISDERIHIRRRDENKGLAYSLNELLEDIYPKGYEYIARMDADDIAEQNRFHKQIGFLASNPEIDVVGGAINEIDENGNNLNHIVKYPITPEECFHFFSKRNPFAHPTVMFRRSFFEKTGCFYPTEYMRNEDTGLWLEGFKKGVKGANLSEVVLNFRVTNAMFAQRRNGSVFAKSQLQLRKKISKELGYGPISYINAHAMYLLMISPSWLIKFAYKILR